MHQRMAVVQKQVSITTTGSAGSATGSGTITGLSGFLIDIYLDYNASAPATTDVTVSESVYGTILTRTDTVTDGRFAVRGAIHDATGAAIANQYDLYCLRDSTLTFSIAQSNALTDCLVAYVRYLEAF